VGAFDEALPNEQAYDLCLRLAEASNHFAAVKETLVIVHQHLGPQISKDMSARKRGVELLDRKWGPVVKRRLGPRGYREWIARRYASVQYLQLRWVREAMARGERRAAWRYCAAMCQWIPWSRKFLLEGVALTLLGWRSYQALVLARDALVSHAALDSLDGYGTPTETK